METETLTASLLARGHANYQELFRAMARFSPDGAIEEQDGVMLARSGHLLPFLNFAAVFRPPSDPAAVLARAQAFFFPFGLRFMLCTVDEAASTMAPVAEAAGMEPNSEPGMLLAPLEGSIPAVPGLRIQNVEDAETLRAYIDTMTAGFGGGPWALPEILADAAMLRVPDITHYLGVINGVPVATATRVTSHRIAGVFNISTIPNYRKRGIGEAITWRAALDGRQEGCIASYLQASELGEPIYLRMGYRTVATYRTWLSAKPDGN
ncbi:MAG: GNAT family N-acetyltransferase [Dehalococcoidia bacterium]